MIFQHIDPDPSIRSPFDIPFRTVSLDGDKFMKSLLSFEMQQDAPVSMQIGFPPGLKFINDCEDC